MKRGTMVLAPFPFTDLSSLKLRPALLVSRSDRADNDVVVAFIGSYRGQVLATADLLIEASHTDFASTGLKASSFIRLDKLATLDGSILLGEIGELSAALVQTVNEKLRYALEL